MNEIPHYAKTGYRWFNHHCGDVVYSVYGMHDVWRPGTTMRTACCECAHGPTPEDGCGLYVLQSKSKLRRCYIRYSANIAGRVAYWGRVQHHKKGSRVEFAQITGFFKKSALITVPPLPFEEEYVTNQVLANLADKYDVPILGRWSK